MKTVLLAIFFLLTLNVSGNSPSYYIKAGKKAFKQGKYETAVFYFSKALEYEQNSEIAWLAAEAARNIKDYEKSEKWYQYVADNSSDKYPLAYFWLAMVQKSLAKYQKAQINFRKYLQKNSAKKDYYTLKARHEVLSCEMALMLTFDKVNIKINTFDSIINSPYSEFQAYIDNDSIMWLTSYKPLFNEDSLSFTSKLLSLKQINNRWELLPIDTILNSNNLYVSSFFISKNKEKMILSICKKDYNRYLCNLYKSKLENGLWQKPQKLNFLENFENATMTHPNIIETDTVNYLIFASNRSDGFGKLDLWAVKINNEWEPIDSCFNLGKNINSIDNECCPFYDLKTKTLYFSSEWHTNLGGFDIFKSYGWITNLYPPQNLGYPINTNNDEVFFQISSDRTKALFASTRSNKSDYEKCCNDIFSYDFEKPSIDSIKKAENLITYKKKAEELIPIYLYFNNDEPNPRSWDTVTSFSYDELYNKYITQREVFIKYYTAPLKGEEKFKAEAKIDAFFTEEVEKNYQKLIVFFNTIKQLLAEGETIILTIKGYASPLNTHDYNLNLSKRRIQSLINLIYKYEDGIFVKYLNNSSDNGGKLIIIREAFGENMVKEGISDDLKDLRNSVYSPEASFERKIAIIAVKMKK
jgi:tetratricopeptide (TPR) repeat protein